MDDNPSTEIRSEDLPDELDQLLLRMSAVEDTITKTREKKTQSSQTSQSDIPESIEPVVSESVNTVNFLGTQFDVEKGNPKFQICLWIFIQSLAFLISYIYIKSAYETWRNSSIVMYQSSKVVPVRDIPFPAVTICLASKLNKATKDEFLEALEQCLYCEEPENSPLLWEEDPALKCYFDDTCDQNIIRSGFLTLKLCSDSVFCNKCTMVIKAKDAINNAPVINGTLHSYFQRILSPCEMLPDFTIQVDSHEPVKACDEKRLQWFVADVTWMRQCVTYNGIPQGDIYKSHVVLPLPFTLNGTTPHNSGPILEFSGREQTGLAIKDLSFTLEHWNVDNYRDTLFSCGFYPPEMSIHVHNPGEVPLKTHLDSLRYRVASDVSSIETEVHNKILVTPRMISADSGITDYDPFHRNCYFPNERQLSLFKVYSEMKCELECYVNCSIKECGCVAFDFPRPNVSVNICLDSYCKPQCDCNCIPDCEALRFDVTLEIQPTPWSVAPKPTIINVTFKNNECRPQVRYSLSSFTEFVAYCLGVLGTFNGLSMIALYKLVHWTILKLWTSVISGFRKLV